MSGENLYGLDADYFKHELALLSQSLDNRTPEEVSRYLIRLSPIPGMIRVAGIPCITVVATGW